MLIIYRCVACGTTVHINAESHDVLECPKCKKKSTYNAKWEEKRKEAMSYWTAPGGVLHI